MNCLKERRILTAASFRFFGKINLMNKKAIYDLINKIEREKIIKHNNLIKQRSWPDKNYLINELKRGNLPEEQLHDYFSLWNKENKMEIDLPGSEFITTIDNLVNERYEKMKSKYNNYFLNQNVEEIIKYINAIEKSFLKVF